MRFARSCLLPLLFPLSAWAGTETLIDLVAVPNSAGLGALQRVAYTPYRGAAAGLDLIPLYIYEGPKVYLHGTRVGWKLREKERYGLDVFVDYRYEGFPYEKTPAILAGMRKRDPAVDLGVSYRYRRPYGNFDLEYLHDANHTHHGSEARFEYSIDLDAGRWQFRPALSFARRSGPLNDYYYGVRADEATPTRPAYHAAAGTDWSLNLYASYTLTERWRALGSIGFIHHSDQVRRSPIVEDKAEPSLQFGVAYDFGSHQPYSAPNEPLRLRLFAGRATECNFLPAVTFRCGSTRSQDDTRLWGFDLSRPLVEDVHGWPLDFTAAVGLLAHDERGVQPDGVQLNAQIKALYYGFPWSRRVKTRLGFGAGFSLAQRVPLTEERDQSRRGRATSRLLNYLDPTIDVSVGDLLGVPRWHDNYLGIGISHRSGIFGTSQLLGNINGGSNYFYAYVETKL
ncbi:MAG TPA: MipA/OmpV family protein [Telluria sp.]|nr:MipA/OmpV family protein [Telluria sp.]